MAQEFSFRHGIAVIQIVAFTAFLLAACWMGWRKRNGWFCVGALSIIRIVGSTSLLATIAYNSRSVWAAVYVCESMGLMLLTFMLLGMLERANHYVSIANVWAFRAPWLMSWASIGLSVADFSVAARNGTTSEINPYGIAGTVLFLAIFTITAGLAVFFWYRRSLFRIEESGQIMCVVLCVPVLAIRVAYMLADRFAAQGNRTFSAVHGSPPAYLLMSALPEIAVMGACTWAIYKYGRHWAVYGKVDGKDQNRDSESLQTLAPR